MSSNDFPADPWGLPVAEDLEDEPTPHEYSDTTESDTAPAGPEAHNGALELVAASPAPDVAPEESAAPDTAADEPVTIVDGPSEVARAEIEIGDWDAQTMDDAPAATGEQSMPGTTEPGTEESDTAGRIAEELGDLAGVEQPAEQVKRATRPISPMLAAAQSVFGGPAESPDVDEMAQAAEPAEVAMEALDEDLLQAQAMEEPEAPAPAVESEPVEDDLDALVDGLHGEPQEAVDEVVELLEPETQSDEAPDDLAEALGELAGGDVSDVAVSTESELAVTDAGLHVMDDAGHEEPETSDEAGEDHGSGLGEAVGWSAVAAAAAAATAELATPSEEPEDGPETLEEPSGEAEEQVDAEAPRIEVADSGPIEEQIAPYDTTKLPHEGGQAAEPWLQTDPDRESAVAEVAGQAEDGIGLIEVDASPAEELPTSETVAPPAGDKELGEVAGTIAAETPTEEASDTEADVTATETDEPSDTLAAETPTEEASDIETDVTAIETDEPADTIAAASGTVVSPATEAAWMQGPASEVAGAQIAAGAGVTWGARWQEAAQGWVEDDAGQATWRPIVATVDGLGEWEVDTYLGVVSGDASLPVGESATPHHQLGQARTGASRKMVDEALSRGAHAVVGVEVSVNELAGFVVVTALGTAVTLKTRD